MLLHKQIMTTCMFILLISCTQHAMASEVTVYKSPSCGCCGKWIDHLKEAGFEATAINQTNMDSIKEQYSIPQRLRSCHTALVEGYIIEGHVPASDIQRLLQEKPDIAGLTAPGMPRRSPGMHATGLKPRKYDVLTFDKSGHTSIFKHY